MTTPEPGPPPSIVPELQQIEADQLRDERKRRWLLLLLLLLLSLIVCVGFLFYKYLTKPEPLPEMLPEVIAKQVVYPPTYMFSINNIDEPTGVAVSPDGQRIYVAESGGERLIKMFDRDGNLIQTFAPPGTTASDRKPTYLAVDANGRVFVSDIYNHVIDIFDPDGNFLDAILGPEITISEFVANLNDGVVPPGTQYSYSILDQSVRYQFPGQPVQSHPFPLEEGWSPIGVRFDNQGNLLTTNIVAGEHSVVTIPAVAINGSLQNFNPRLAMFGEEGKGDGQFSFPNSVVTDSRGNFYVSDGNNGRISAWTSDMQYETFFGFGTAESGLNLPRGAWMDNRDYLHVADAVGQVIRVYDVSVAEPAFLFNFGEFGIAGGQFNFPVDVVIDVSKRVYIADRQNNRIEVWSY